MFKCNWKITIDKDIVILCTISSILTIKLILKLHQCKLISMLISSSYVRYRWYQHHYWFSIFQNSISMSMSSFYRRYRPYEQQSWSWTCIKNSDNIETFITINHLYWPSWASIKLMWGKVSTILRCSARIHNIVNTQLC